jgi:hypothetical protein
MQYNVSRFGGYPILSAPLTPQKINNSKLYKGLYILGRRRRRRRRMPYNKDYF